MVAYTYTLAHLHTRQSSMYMYIYTYRQVLNAYVVNDCEWCYIYKPDYNSNDCKLMAKQESHTLNISHIEDRGVASEAPCGVGY